MQPRIWPSSLPSIDCCLDCSKRRILLRWKRQRLCQNHSDLHKVKHGIIKKRVVRNQEKGAAGRLHTRPKQAVCRWIEGSTLQQWDGRVAGLDIGAGRRGSGSLAGVKVRSEAEAAVDGELDYCVSICNFIGWGTTEDCDRVTEGLTCSGVRQIHTLESDPEETWSLIFNKGEILNDLFYTSHGKCEQCEQQIKRAARVEWVTSFHF